MKRILILVTQRGDNSNNLESFLNTELENEAKVTVVEFSDVTIEVNQKKVTINILNQNIDEFDLVYFRKVKKGDKNYTSLAGTIALYLDSKKIPYIDSLFANVGVGTKLYPLVKMSLSKMPVIPTFYCSAEGVNNNTPYIESTFGYPLIVKNLHLQKLKGIYVVHDRKEIIKLLKLNYESYIFQKYIEIKDEYRLLVLGGKVKVTSKKVKRSYKKLKVDYLDYSSQEEFVNVNEVDKNIINIAEHSSKLLNLEIAGVDVIVDENGKHWIVEVNRGPGINYDYSATSELKEVANFLKDRLK